MPARFVIPPVREIVVVHRRDGACTAYPDRRSCARALGSWLLGSGRVGVCWERPEPWAVRMAPGWNLEVTHIVREHGAVVPPDVLMKELPAIAPERFVDPVDRPYAGWRRDPVPYTGVVHGGGGRHHQRFIDYPVLWRDEDTGVRVRIERRMHEPLWEDFPPRGTRARSWKRHRRTQWRA